MANRIRALWREGQAATKARASAGLSIIGPMMPIAPASNSLPMMPGSFQGARASGTTGCGWIAWKQATAER